MPPSGRVAISTCPRRPRRGGGPSPSRRGRPGRRGPACSVSIPIPSSLISSTSRRRPRLADQHVDRGGAACLTALTTSSWAIAQHHRVPRAADRRARHGCSATDPARWEGGHSGPQGGLEAAFAGGGGMEGGDDRARLGDRLVELGRALGPSSRRPAARPSGAASARRAAIRPGARARGARRRGPRTAAGRGQRPDAPPRPLGRRRPAAAPPGRSPLRSAPRRRCARAGS